MLSNLRSASYITNISNWTTNGEPWYSLTNGTVITNITGLSTNRVHDYVVTFAGSLSGTSGTNDGTGTNARFNTPWGITINTVNNDIYVSDKGNHRIRKITSAGVVTTLAGFNQGFGDGNGTAAEFSHPMGMIYDGSAIYVADSWNHCIRRVTTSGNVTTFAGSNIIGYNNASGLSARFNYPRDIDYSSISDCFYVADTVNHMIRKITSGGTVSLLAGSTTSGDAEGSGSAARFNEPWGVCVEPSGSIYVTDNGNNRVKKVTSAGAVSWFAFSGLDETAQGYIDGAAIKSPVDLLYVSETNIYVSDFYYSYIMDIRTNQLACYMINNGNGYNNGFLTNARFSGPAGMAKDSYGNIYIVDYGNNCIRKIYR